VIPAARRFRSWFRRSRVAALVVAALLAVGAPRVYAQLRLGVVDLQRALVESEQGRRASGILRGLFQQRQEELDRRQRELVHQREEIERQRSSLPREELQHRMEQYQTDFVALQQNFLEFQQELSQREAELTKSIFSNLRETIRQLGAQENMSAIFEQNGVVWSPQHLDLTDRVVQMFNQRFPGRTLVIPASLADAGVRSAPQASTDSGASSRADARANVRNPHPRGENQPPSQQ
jgi:outer membrane protein